VCCCGVCHARIADHNRRQLIAEASGGGEMDGVEASDDALRLASLTMHELDFAGVQAPSKQAVTIRSNCLSTG
jgi:hypothetical protein